MLKLPTYVLVTPARNEAQLIEGTIKSVVAQSALPLKWVIVSDGSTDGTDEIVSTYALKYEWIELLRMPERTERHFAGKAFAFQAGKERLDELTYDTIANLDADITFEPDHFRYLLGKMAADPSLGVIGTPYVETTGEAFDYRFTSLDHVSGACQLFSRDCYEGIGGYVPVKVGTIDCIAVMTARMKGWKTRTFTGKVSVHHRKTGTAEHRPMKANFYTGVMDYTMGNHPLWQLFRIAYQMSRKPFVMRGAALGVGFVWAWLRRTRRPVSRELMKFHRREQMERLRSKLRDKTFPDNEVLLSRAGTREAQ